MQVRFQRVRLPEFAYDDDDYTLPLSLWLKQERTQKLREPTVRRDSRDHLTSEDTSQDVDSRREYTDRHRWPGEANDGSKYHLESRKSEVPSKGNGEGKPYEAKQTLRRFRDWNEKKRNIRFTKRILTRSRSHEYKDLPLYIPPVKAVNVEEIMRRARSKGEDVELEHAYQWLTQAKLYERLLRASPRRKAPIFNNREMIPHIKQLLAAGYIEVAKKSALKAYCKVFSVAEPEKKRRRLIIEPRELNKRWHEGYARTHLPKITAIKEMLKREELKGLTICDFKCWFYQIQLYPEIRKFFGIKIGQEFFQLKRLPMGGVYSVFIAQALSKFIQCEIGQGETYIDNLLFTMINARRSTKPRTGTTYH